MSSNDESPSDEGRDFENDDEEYSYEDESESSEDVDEEYDEEGEVALSEEDNRLLDAVWNDDEAAAEQAIRDGANVNAVRINWSEGFRTDWTPLFDACENGNDQISRILLDAGADAWWRDSDGYSVIDMACINGHFSTVQLLINHDNGLLETVDDDGSTPLLVAMNQEHSDIVRFLLDSGANPHHVNNDGETSFMHACQYLPLDNVRLLLAFGVDVEARSHHQRTALHHAALDGDIEVLRELILQHNANMFAVDEDGRTPFDLTCVLIRRDAAANALLELYANKLTRDHGRLALHELLQDAEYSFAEYEEFRPPLDPLQVIVPLGKLRWNHFRTLMHTLDPELIRNRDDTGKLPIHIACQTNAPVEILAWILQLDATTLHIADFTGALPIHLLCGTTTTTEYASALSLVEQGGVGTLAARNHEGALPLHVLCGSTNPSLRTVQYLIQSFPGSVVVQTNAGQYPFMMAAAADSSAASLSVIYELVRANPGLVVPR